MKYIYRITAVLILLSCSKKRSSVTGSEFNNPNNGGFMKAKFNGQKTGPGLVFVEGGYLKTNNGESSIPSFYMDANEITNHNWNEYLYWTKRVFTDFPLVYENALPNKLVFLENGVYNDPMFENYFNHPAYDDYPIVGVSWLQANNFCAWRTDRVNENILIKEGILFMNLDQQNEPFTTGAYLDEQYEDRLNEKGSLVNLDQNKGRSMNGKIKTKDLPSRYIKIEDGILLPKYRLPNQYEWEYASKSPIAKQTTRIWKGSEHKNYTDKNFAKQFASKTQLTPVNAYWPNDYGLYCMNSNVSEWVMDTYLDGKGHKANIHSPLMGESLIKVNQKGGSYFKLYLDASDKYDEVIYDVSGLSKYINKLKISTNKELKDSLIERTIEIVRICVNKARKLYDKGILLDASREIRYLIDTDLPDFHDRIIRTPGLSDIDLDFFAVIYRGISKFIIDLPGNIPLRKITPTDNLITSYKLTPEMAQYIPVFDYQLNDKLKSDNKLYKGKSYRDTISVSKARYLDKYLSSSTIGFRCAMDCLGIQNKRARKQGKSNKNISYFEELDAKQKR